MVEIEHGFRRLGCRHRASAEANARIRSGAWSDLRVTVARDLHRSDPICRATRSRGEMRHRVVKRGPTLACAMVRVRRIRQSVGNDERLCKSGFDGPAHDLDPLGSIPVASRTTIRGARRIGRAALRNRRAKYEHIQLQGGGPHEAGAGITSSAASGAKMKPRPAFSAPRRRSAAIAVSVVAVPLRMGGIGAQGAQVARNRPQG